MEPVHVNTPLTLHGELVLHVVELGLRRLSLVLLLAQLLQHLVPLALQLPHRRLQLIQLPTQRQRDVRVLCSFRD